MDLPGVWLMNLSLTIPLVFWERWLRLEVPWITKIKNEGPSHQRHVTFSNIIDSVGLQQNQPGFGIDRASVGISQNQPRSETYRNNQPLGEGNPFDFQMWRCTFWSRDNCPYDWTTWAQFWLFMQSVKGLGKLSIKIEEIIDWYWIFERMY